jgi:hypothetical protein
MAIERDRPDNVTDWMPLWQLRKGAIFETRSGTRAVKSEYASGNQCECVLLASGEYAHFVKGNATEVREIEVPE